MALKAVIDATSFKTLVGKLLHYVLDTERAMTVACLKDVSSLLAMISAVRECDLERHLQSERDMLKLTFAFDHQHYASYCIYQHVYLRNLEQQDHPAFMEMKERGFGGSISGGAFSTIHGDLITELFNKQTKGTAGPFRCGFSKNMEAVNTWVRTIHIHCKLRETFREQLLIKTSSVHKEVTLYGKNIHHQHVKMLKEQLARYGVNPFSNGLPKFLPTGEEIENTVVRDMLNAAAIGNTHYEAFVKERLSGHEKFFFEPIKRIKLNTGLVRAIKTPKAISILKEDRQAFGLIIAKAASLDEAFSYPITSVPLSVATPEGTLRQSDKASLRNFLITDSDASTEITPKNCISLVDGLAAIRTLKPKLTCKPWIESLVHFITPPRDCAPIGIGLISDTYPEKSAKGGTRSKRGESGPKVQIDSVHQHMLQGNKWQDFLHNGENKEELVRVIDEYLPTVEGRRLLTIPLVLTSGEKTSLVGDEGIRELFNCNHEEADTRLVLHASLENTNIIVVSKDTDVLVLMIWAYEKCQISPRKWYMKYDHMKYADIGEICSFLGTKISFVLPSFHAITGCDTTPCTELEVY